LAARDFFIPTYPKDIVVQSGGADLSAPVPSKVRGILLAVLLDHICPHRSITKSIRCPALTPAQSARILGGEPALGENT